MFDKLELSDTVKWFIQRYDNKYEEKKICIFRKIYNTYIKGFSLISYCTSPVFSIIKTCCATGLSVE